MTIERGGTVHHASVENSDTGDEYEAINNPASPARALLLAVLRAYAAQS